MAYIILSTNCEKDIKEDIIINEFNKIKSTLPVSPEGMKALRNITSGLGMFFMQKDQYPKALTYLQESQHLSEDLNLTDATHAQNNASLSLIHLNIGNYKEAEKYIGKSLQVGHQIKDTLSLGNSYLTMAQLQLKIEDKVKAQRYIDSAMYVMKNVKQCEPCYNTAKIVNAGVKNLSGNYSAALTEL